MTPNLSVDNAWVMHSFPFKCPLNFEPNARGTYSPLDEFPPC
jgi:hypothetical protein